MNLNIPFCLSLTHMFFQLCCDLHIYFINICTKNLDVGLLVIVAIWEDLQISINVHKNDESIDWKNRWRLKHMVLKIGSEIDYAFIYYV